MNEYTAQLKAPNGEISTYEVTARNKTLARKAVRRAYREDTPSPKNGFYAFEQHKLTWVEEKDEPAPRLVYRDRDLPFTYF
ncbi:MAG: hypothetical protein EOP83_17340 [Verrucomicrobiaceae bacterium]|nr:MAG: hypothetical protein EOP83_17340 [Verrucomicrobiaceae bacterium]